MRVVKLAILICLVIAAFGLLLFAGSYARSLSSLSRLEAGERGIVAQMLQAGMVRELESYHLRHIESCGIKLPPSAPYARAEAHPQAERFFYVDAAGNVTIKGLSDQNVPEDYSQRCVLFADARLTWFKIRLLLDALIDERIRYLYFAASSPDGLISYTPLEIICPGAFPMLYPHRVCLLGEDALFYYYEDERVLSGFENLEQFREIAGLVREKSASKKPFLRILAMDNVTCATVYRVISMFKPSGVQSLVKLRSGDREFILADALELAGRAKERAEKQEEGQ